MSPSKENFALIKNQSVLICALEHGDPQPQIRANLDASERQVKLLEESDKAPLAQKLIFQHSTYSIKAKTISK